MLAGAVLVIALVSLIVYATYYPGLNNISTSTSKPTSSLSTSSTPITSSSIFTSPTSSTSGSTFTNSSSQAASQVQLQISDWDKSIDNRSVDNMMNLYTNSSVVSLDGNGTYIQCSPIVVDGTYTGVSKNSGITIRSLYTVELAALDPSLSLVTISNLTLKDIGGGGVNATFRLFLNATGPDGVVKASANVQQQWTNQGGSGEWHILKENWVYQTTYVQSPVC